MGRKSVDKRHGMATSHGSGMAILTLGMPHLIIISFSLDGHLHSEEFEVAKLNPECVRVLLPHLAASTTRDKELPTERRTTDGLTDKYIDTETD